MSFMRIIVTGTLLGVVGCAEQAPPSVVEQLTYPATKATPVVDDYHGTEVADPYRWLEELTSDEVGAWVASQNETTRGVLAESGLQPRIREVVEETLRYARQGNPVQRGSRYFYSYSDGVKNQPVIYVTEDLDEPGKVLLDPNTLSDDGTMALGNYEVSPDGRYLAYAISDGGSDWRNWYVIDTVTGERLDEELTDIKFTDVSFDSTGDALFYSRYPRNEAGQADDQLQVHMYRHVIGTPQSEDTFVFAITDHPTRNPYGIVSEDGRYLIIGVFDGFDSNGIYFLPLTEGLPVEGTQPTRLFDDWDALYEFLGNDGSVFYFFTNKDAPRARVIAVDTAADEPTVTEVVSEREETLLGANYVGGRFILEYTRDAYSYVVVADREGNTIEVDLPGLGTATGFAGAADNPVTFYSYEDFARRERVYQYDVERNESRLIDTNTPGASSSNVVTEQVFVESKDGTRVPAFIVRRADVEPDGATPTLLYGYGGFDVTLTPAYGAMSAAWVQMGGLFVSANLRGGGEYGAEWHAAGRLHNKQNVFDDFIAVAEWLIDSGYTQPKHLGITGRSNGGLLVGAVLTQRPDLFGVALPAVGVLDMLRYHTASANARAWSSDYGLSEDPEQFETLFAYSPYHRVEDGTCYPPTLVTAADRDDRVVPWHSYKFAARLQAAQSCDAPTLLLVETRAGHGAGKPIAMQVDDHAAQLSFAAKALGLIPPNE